MEKLSRDDQRGNCHWPNGLSSIKIWSWSKSLGFLKSSRFLSKTIIMTEEGRFSICSGLQARNKLRGKACGVQLNVPSLKIQKTEGSLLGSGPVVDSRYVRTRVNIAVGIGMCLPRKCSTWLLYYMHLLSLLQLHSRRKRIKFRYFLALKYHIQDIWCVTFA